MSPAIFGSLQYMITLSLIGWYYDIETSYAYHKSEESILQNSDGKVTQPIRITNETILSVQFFRKLLTDVM